MRLHASILIAFVVVGSMAIGTTAFTSATVDRSATADIVADDDGLVALQDNATSNLVYQKTNGELAVDFTKGGATGINNNAKFVIGDSSGKSATVKNHAFNVTNQDTEQHSFTFDYTSVTADDGNSQNNLKFTIFYDDASDTETAINDTKVVSEDSTTKSLTLASAETVYVVITADTNGSGINTGDDLSGTFKVKV